MKINQNYFAAILIMITASFLANKAVAQTSGSLYYEIEHMDSLQFGAFNARNLDQLMQYFDNSLELYQDNTGVRNYDQTRQAFDGLFKMDYVLTRKLLSGTLEIYPIKDYVAIETGQHTFSHMEKGQYNITYFNLKYYEICL